jgi:predicted O-methyltransferase YrrM
VYSTFQLAVKYFNYYLKGANSKGHGIHSPFVFDFILNVLNNKDNSLPPAEIEELRRKLLADNTLIEVEDMGAGSRLASSNTKQVGQIARTALKSPRYGQLLYRLVKYYLPADSIELGTSLGITSAYLASGNKEGRLTTVEGSRAIRNIAQKNFETLGLSNIDSLLGNFDAVLPKLLQEKDVVNLAYVDGNHLYSPTINYFQQLLKKADHNSIFIFDDIYWSVEMEKAWKEIKSHPDVQCTIDIFFLGFVFFRKEFKVKQHFIIRY